MTTRLDPTARAKERRYVLARVATLLDSELANGSEWIAVDEAGNDADERVVRCREEVLRDIAAELRRRSEFVRPHGDGT